MSRTITLVSGALKNVGDFLIFNKSREMIQRHLRPSDTISVIRTDNVKKHLKAINDTNAVFICGGPGYQKHFVPNVYPFLKYYDEIEVPIFPFALGWRGIPLYHPTLFTFSSKSKNLLRMIHDEIPYSSTRDEITKQILMREGVSNVVNTGCPTLFDPDNISIDSPFKMPEEVSAIAISMAQNPLLHPQNIELLNQAVSMFPGARVFAIFHRGTGADKHTSRVEGVHLQKLAEKALESNCEVIDLAYNVDAIRVYQQADIHIGYRVHGHAYAISQRIPSFLLWEDGRGQGMSLNLRTGGTPALVPRVLSKVPKPRRLDRAFTAVERRTPFLYQPRANDAAIDTILTMIKEQIRNNFMIFKDVPNRLVRLYSRMKSFFSTIDAVLDS